MSTSLHPEPSGPEEFGRMPTADVTHEGSAGADHIDWPIYSASDPDHLVTAAVGGDGVVVRIWFGAAAVGSAPGPVEQAVLAAVAAAQREREMARRELAEEELAGSSPDERVVVRATGAGRLTQLRLLEGVLRHCDDATLGDLVTRTVRDTQLRARARLERAVARRRPPGPAAEQTPPSRGW